MNERKETGGRGVRGDTKSVKFGKCSPALKVPRQRTLVLLIEGFEDGLKWWEVTGW
jgi:hypothetical protein